MANIEVEPLALDASERIVVNKYIKTFNAFMKLSYDDDPYDAFKIAEYGCMCERFRKEMKDLYEQIPQIVKNENLVPKPEYPYF